MEARPFPDRRFSERSHLALSGVLSTLCPLVDDQIIDPRQFGMTQAFDNERRRGFAGACPAGEARTFERVCRWKNEAFLLQPLHQCADNRFAPIGPLRSSCGEIERERYIPSPKRV